MSMIDTAIAFAATAHAEQRRKYTGEPYIFHPIEVCQILIEHGIGDEDTLVGAILHDTVEDCEWVTHKDIERRFGPGVAAIVFDLTDQYADPTMGDRAYRKEREAKRLTLIGAKSQNVKAADLISNTTNIVQHDMGFARIYLPEKREILRGLTQIDPGLRVTLERSLVTEFSALYLEDLHGGK